MNFKELHALLTQELGLTPSKLDSGTGWSYFFGPVERGPKTTRILRLKNDGDRVLEVKRSMSSLNTGGNVLLPLPLLSSDVRSAVAEELAILKLR